MKKVAEKIEMGLDAQKRFAQMHEDRYMHETIRGQDGEAGSHNNTGVQKRN